MGITKRRGLEIGMHMRNIVSNVNAITEEELEAFIHIIDRDQALGPLLDPTAWRDEQLFESSTGIMKVVRALLDFKKAVSGIGNFA